MSDLFFVFKMLIMTTVVVFFMQIQIGKQTLEKHSLAWIRTSPLIGQLQEVADGAVILITKIYGEATAKLSSSFRSRIDPNNQPGNRHLNLKLERSKEYIQKKAREAKEKVTKMANEKFDELTEEVKSPTQPDYTSDQWEEE